MSGPDFNSIDDSLTVAGAAVRAAEAHGSLCGSLCSLPASDSSSWLDNVLADVDPSNAQKGTTARDLERLREATRDSLAEGQMEFQPLLPDDDTHIVERTGALAHWCQGFLYGLAMGGFTDLKSLPEVVQEIVADFSEITKAGVDDDDDVQEAEESFAELVEFVRVSTQLTFEELAGFRDSTAEDTGGLH